MNAIHPGWTEWLAEHRRWIGAAALGLLWAAEAAGPRIAGHGNRLGHDARNLGIALANTLLAAFLFAGATAAAAGWAQARPFGLLHLLDFPSGWRLIPALLAFDLWMYLWHRANHAVPALWRFHRMHHSDEAVDATTGVRFHPGEIAISALLRLAVVPVLGMTLGELLVYESLLLPVILFHHSDIRLNERADRWLRRVIVSPAVHRVHHSDRRLETDSNFGSVFVWWDRIAGTYREARGPIRFGLAEFRSPADRTLGGMLAAPLNRRRRTG